MLQLSFWVFCIDLLVQVTFHLTLKGLSPVIIHKDSQVFFPYADIKGFLTDVKPALLSTLDAEYEKNPFEVNFV